MPRALAALVMRCLEKRPADRPQSADEVLRELEAAATSPSGISAVHQTRPGDAVDASAPGAARASRRVGRAAVITGIAVAVVLLIYGAVSFARHGRAVSAPSRPVAVGAPADARPEMQKAIAVLPFVNLSAEQENEYFSDGMTEELIDALSKVEGLRVAARTSSFAFKGKNEDVGEIGRKLHVGAVVEGSVRR